MTTNVLYPQTAKRIPISRLPSVVWLRKRGLYALKLINTIYTTTSKGPV